MNARYLFRCPDCGSTMLATNPDAVIWELCQGCFKHAWDQYDVQMADRYIAEKRVLTNNRLQANN